MNAAPRKISYFTIVFFVLVYCPYLFATSQDFQFSDKHEDYKVNEGTDIHLTCERETLKDIYVDGKLFVENSTLNSSFNNDLAEKYVYTEYDNSFRIKNISRSDGGMYYCRDAGTGLNIQTLNLNILYHPGKVPICNAQPGSLRYSNGELQREVQFVCITEEGNPSVDIAIYLKKQTYDENITITDMSEGDITKKILNFSSYYNDTYINPEFTCNVTQSKPSFEDSCSFKPLSLSLKFEVKIKPDCVTISDGKNTTLTCGSDESNVQTFSWIRVPSNLMYFKNGSTLTIYGVSGKLGDSSQITCQGSYGGLRVKATATIYEGSDVSSLAGQPYQTVCSVLVLLCITFALITCNI